MKVRLGILSTHPVQYYSPLFRYLAAVDSLDLSVYYCQKPTPEQQGIGFGLSFTWDVDLISGYRAEWLRNISKNPSLGSFFGCDTPEISGIIARERFDAFLVLGWYTKSMWQAMRACWQTGTPLMVRGDSHLHVDTVWAKRAVKTMIYPWFIKKFDACLAVGTWSAEYFSSYGARRIYKSPHFVDNERFANVSKDIVSRKSAIREEWGITPESRVFLFVGKFEDKKRPLDLLKAARRLLCMGFSTNHFHVLMVGTGKLFAECTQFASQNALPVTFAGFLNQSEIPKAYAVSDVLVLPSDGRETWGLVVNEAMASGLPAIVSSEVGCSVDLIEDGKTGYVYPTGDIDELVHIMLLMINNQHVSTMGIAAQDNVMLNYTVEKAGKGVITAFEDIIWAQKK